MSEKIREARDKTNFKSNKYFKINSCGVQNYSGKTYPILRSRGRIDYHILYMTDGSCTVMREGEEVILKAGELILYKPHEKQYYSFNAPSSKSYWLHFSGLGAEEVLKRLGLWIKSIYTVGHDERILRLFNDIIRENTLKEYQYEVVCQGKLTELLGLISRIATSEINASVADNRRLVYGIIEKMCEEPGKKILSEEAAAMCGLSRSRYEHVFKEVIGMPPRRYQTKICIDRACYLLKNTQLSIAEVGNMTGFDDPLYFSRAFKKFIGISPAKYRLTQDL